MSTSNNGNANVSNESIPPVLRFWSGMYNAVPKIYLPGTKFDVSFTIVCSIVIFSVRLLFDSIFQGYLGWNPNSKYTTDCAASAASIFHSVVLCTGLASALRYVYPSLPIAKMSEAPQWWQDVANALLQFCTGYMFYDFFGMLRDNNWAIDVGDIAFVGHHIATVAYMSSCRSLGVGHISSMALMLTGELTNPLQNALHISRYAIQVEPVGTLWHVTHPYIELVYAVCYSFVRLVVGPVQIINITYHLLFTKLGRERVPLYTGLVWVALIWGIILGSLPWTFEAIAMVKDGLEVKYDRHFDYGPRFEL